MNYFLFFSEIINTPEITNKVPMICIQVILSSKKKYASTMVETGPIPPIIEAFEEPIRKMPSESKKEGSTVLSKAMVSASKYTSLLKSPISAMEWLVR